MLFFTPRVCFFECSANFSLSKATVLRNVFRQFIGSRVWAFLLMPPILIVMSPALAGAVCPSGADGDRAPHCSPDVSPATSPETKHDYLDPWLGEAEAWPRAPMAASGPPSSSQPPRAVDGERESAAEGEYRGGQEGPRIHVTPEGLPYPPPLGAPGPYPAPVGSQPLYPEPLGQHEAGDGVPSSEALRNADKRQSAVRSQADH